MMHRCMAAAAVLHMPSSKLARPTTQSSFRKQLNISSVFWILQMPNKYQLKEVVLMMMMMNKHSFVKRTTILHHNMRLSSTCTRHRMNRAVLLHGRNSRSCFCDSMHHCQPVLQLKDFSALLAWWCPISALGWVTETLKILFLWKQTSGLQIECTVTNLLCCSELLSFLQQNFYVMMTLVSERWYQTFVRRELLNLFPRTVEIKF